MKQSYYIFNDGKIKREDGSILFKNTDKEKKPLPIETIKNIYIFGDVEFNTKFINFISQNKISLHFFNYYGFYSGSFYPKEYLLSGFLLLNQVEFYQNKDRRLSIAKEIIEAAIYNILSNLRYYNNRDKDLQSEIHTIENLKDSIKNQNTISQLMAIEGNARSNYYQAFNKILKEDGFSFTKRTRRPPDNPINALISFGNTIMYTTTLSEIYHTQLNPLISFLHEPGERRYSLSLDLAEIFKPMIIDRIIFKIINTRQITEKHFDKNINFCYLKETGRKIFLKNYEEKLKQTIYHRKLKKQVSYLQLIKLECYKLIKHLTKESPYEGFRIWW